MSTITAVPIRPARRSTLVWIWAAIAVLAAGAAMLAFAAPVDPTASFLTRNRGETGVTETASGLQYKVLTPAPKGAVAPTDADVALVMYDGQLTDGSRFDRSERPTPFPLGEGATVPGFEEALKLIPKGAKYRFWLKPALAYGDAEKRDQSGKVVIPAGSVLVFDIQMLDHLPKSVVRQMQMAAPGTPPPGQ